MASLSVDSVVWRCIWHSEASRKCKSLVWRACNEELRVKSLLLSKGIVEDATCPSCCKDIETITHALLQCEEVKGIWFATPLCLRVEWFNATNLAQWIEQCGTILDRKQMGFVCAMIWAIWEKRNQWVFEHKKVYSEQVFENAKAILKEKGPRLDDWQPPLRPKVKANFCAFLKEDRGTGMGVIFRNSSGATIASGTKFLKDECYEPVIAEALCYTWALAQSGELGLSNIIFETECLELFTHWKQALKGEIDDSDAYLESLVQECKTMIKGTGSSLEFVRNTANKLARCLAAVAADYGEKIWTEAVPEEASDYLQSDVEAIANHSSRR